MTRRTPKKIAFIGSSSIYGRGDTELGGFVQRFRFRFEPLNPKNLVYALGIFGENVVSLTQRVSSELSVRRPHLIGLYPGFNDICRIGGEESENTVALDFFRQSILELLQASRKIAPSFVMTGIPFDERRTTPYRDSDSYFFQKDAQLYSQVVREVALSEGTPVLDFESLWGPLEIIPLLSEDGLHANPVGHQLLCEQTWDYISENYF
ncbi:GDSL-type esterase/lipase family protein [Microbulbifer variabilis]|uniref:GDSL-type esterase/lipase family protein n=1 Tax=Microbulbifer variabilis TaxID=266805 RepID=UPI001CFDDDBB|nr:GDSL-type esterase/lipase family protein [Microbulbifer variabilis]